MEHYLLCESALTGQQDVWSLQLQAYVLFRFLSRKSDITQSLGQLCLPWSFKTALCQQIFMGKTTNTDGGNQCNTSSATFLARNSFSGSCAAVMPRKSFPIQAGLRVCCWDRNCNITEGYSLQEQFGRLIESLCLTVDQKEPPVFPVPCSILCFMLNYEIRKVM